MVLLYTLSQKSRESFNKEIGIINQEEINIQKERLTLKNLFGKLISNLAACIYPVLPVFMASGLIGMLRTIFGPTMLGWLDAESGTYQVLVIVYNAGFYFLPIFLGYTSAKHLKMNPLMGMLMGAILIQ